MSKRLTELSKQFKIVRTYKAPKGEEEPTEVTLETAIEHLERSGYWEPGTVQQLLEDFLENPKSAKGLTTPFSIYMFTRIEDKGNNQ